MGTCMFHFQLCIQRSSPRAVSLSFTRKSRTLNCSEGYLWCETVRLVLIFAHSLGFFEAGFWETFPQLRVVHYCFSFSSRRLQSIKQTNASRSIWRQNTCRVQGIHAPEALLNWDVFSRFEFVQQFNKILNKNTFLLQFTLKK